MYPKKQKRTSELRIKTVGGKPAAPSAKLLSKFHRFFHGLIFQQRLGRNQSKTVIFWAKLVPFMAGYVWFISLKNEWPKVGKNYNEHILLLVFFGLPFEKGGNTQICQGFFTLWLEDSKSAIRDHQIRIALKTSENVLRWWGWIIGKRQDPIRIINPNPGIQRKIDEFQTHSNPTSLTYLVLHQKKKEKRYEKSQKVVFPKLFRIISGDFFMSYSLQDLHQGGQNFIVDLSRWISLRWLRCRVTVGWTPSHFSHFFGFFPPLADLDPEDPLDPFSSGSKRRSSATTSGKALWTSW